MTHAPSAFARTLHHGARLLALGALLASPLAQADDYGDVNQLLRQGKSAQALAQADKYLAAKPRDPQMRFLKGVAQTAGGQSADAVATFVQLTQDYPELAEPYNNLAVLYAGKGQYDQAREALEQALRANPSYATAQENLGDVYVQLAARAYGKAQQLEAGNAGVASKLAAVRALPAPGAAASAKTGPRLPQTTPQAAEAAQDNPR